MPRPESTLDCLYRARNEVASSRTDDKLRLQAWVSIRRLYEAYKTAPEPRPEASVAGRDRQDRRLVREHEAPLIVA